MRLKDKFKVEKHLIELLVNIRDIQVASVDLVSDCHGFTRSSKVELLWEGWSVLLYEVIQIEKTEGVVLDS